jgi:hypothetical protein
MISPRASTPQAGLLLTDTTDPTHQQIVELLAERSPEYGRIAQLTTIAECPERIADDVA